MKNPIHRLSAANDNFARELEHLLQMPAAAQIEKTVAEIIHRVKTEGDGALLELSEKYDNFRPSSAAGLWTAPDALDDSAVPAPVSDAMQQFAARVREYHSRQKPQSWRHTDDAGNIVGERIAPVSRAAIYAPGGRAAYPSSVLMGVIPAKVAGVAEVILMTPAKNGKVPPIVLEAAAIAGADKVLILGGAQAVAAAAFGTDTIPRADVVAGPGNAFVAEAKRQLCGVVGIDSLAGPSEVLMIIDSSSNPEWVAADIMAQAEHDENAQCIVVSPDLDHLEKIAEQLQLQVPNQERAEIVKESLARRGALIHAPDMSSCVQIANRVASEHVQVICRDADLVADQIDNAGGLFIGAHSCVAFGDYGAGPNHILPTGGAARFASPLGTTTFMKRTGILQASADGAANLVPTTSLLAEQEGLPAHAASARLRVKME